VSINYEKTKKKLLQWANACLKLKLDDTVHIIKYLLIVKHVKKNHTLANLVPLFSIIIPNIIIFLPYTVCILLILVAYLTRCWLADKQQVTVISVIGDDSLVTGNQVIKLWSSEGPTSGNKPVRKFPGHGSELRQIASLDETYFVSSAIADRLVNVW